MKKPQTPVQKPPTKLGPKTLARLASLPGIAPMLRRFGAGPGPRHRTRSKTPKHIAEQLKQAAVIKRVRKAAKRLADAGTL